MGQQSGDVLRDRIYHLAKEAFRINFDEYLRRKKNRSFWGITIENDKFQHNALFGNPDPRFLSIANQAFKGHKNQSEAGYRVDLGSVTTFASLGLNADVFLINPERLSDEQLNLDALIIHELAHMVVDADLTSQIASKPTRKTTEIGNKMYKGTDREVMHITKHTKEFCLVLASAATLCWKKLGYKDAWDVVARAMKHGDLPNI